MNLSKQVKVQQLEGYTAATTNKITSDIIDMEGFEGVMFIIELGAITAAGGTIDAYVEGDSANATTYMERLAGSDDHTVTEGDYAEAYSCIVIDVYRPIDRYLQCVVDPATQTVVICGITAIQYGPRVLPVTNDDTSVLKCDTLISPADYA
jgi:hypothetical protein